MVLVELNEETPMRAPLLWLQPASALVQPQGTPEDSCYRADHFASSCEQR